MHLIFSFNFLSSLARSGFGNKLLGAATIAIIKVMDEINPAQAKLSSTQMSCLFWQAQLRLA